MVGEKFDEEKPSDDGDCARLKHTQERTNEIFKHIVCINLHNSSFTPLYIMQYNE